MFSKRFLKNKIRLYDFDTWHDSSRYLQTEKNIMGIRGLNTRKITEDLKSGLTDLASGGFKKIFSQINQLSIKQGVDEMGIDKFVNQCALMAAGSGVLPV